eukprot:12073320-Alexandrium_andersonii.AAC.1
MDELFLAGTVSFCCPHVLDHEVIVRQLPSVEELRHATPVVRHVAEVVGAVDGSGDHQGAHDRR